MVLNPENGQFGVFEAGARAIVQVRVAKADFLILERRGVDGEAVVLGGDLDLADGILKHGLVPAPMAELQFIGGSA